MRNLRLKGKQSVRVNNTVQTREVRTWNMAESESHEQVKVKEEECIAEVVFFGLDEGQERAIVEDISNAGILKRSMKEND